MAVYRPKYRDPKTRELVESEIWWYEFSFAGKRYRESAKTPLKTIARDAEQQRRRELEKTLAGLPVEKRERRIHAIKELIAAYLKHYGDSHRAKSVIFAEQRLAHVERILGSALLPDLTEERIREYIHQRLAEGVSGRTVNMEVGELSRAIGQEWSTLWPRVRKLEERKDVGRALSPEEEARLIDALPRIKSPIVGFFVRESLMTGMRAGELQTLTWGQVDFSSRVITVGKAKTSSGTGRQIPMNRDLYAILSAHASWFAGS
jgi:integrase